MKESMSSQAEQTEPMETDIYSPIHVVETWQRVGARMRRNIHVTVNADESGIYESPLGNANVDLTRLSEPQSVLGIGSDILKGIRRGVNKKQPDVIDVYISKAGGHGKRDLNRDTRLSIFYPQIRKHQLVQHNQPNAEIPYGSTTSEAMTAIALMEYYHQQGVDMSPEEALSVVQAPMTP